MRFTLALALILGLVAFVAAAPTLEDEIPKEVEADEPEATEVDEDVPSEDEAAPEEAEDQEDEDEEAEDSENDVEEDPRRRRKSPYRRRRRKLVHCTRFRLTTYKRSWPVVCQHCVRVVPRLRFRKTKLGYYVRGKVVYYYTRCLPLGRIPRPKIPRKFKLKKA